MIDLHALFALTYSDVIGQEATSNCTLATVTKGAFVSPTDKKCAELLKPSVCTPNAASACAYITVDEDLKTGPIVEVEAKYRNR